MQRLALICFFEIVHFSKISSFTQKRKEHKMKKETGRRFPDRWKVGRIKFTMIELLIVISIIMILASLFLPALQKARLHALSTNCIANLRGIGQAFSIY